MTPPTDTYLLPGITGNIQPSGTITLRTSIIGPEINSANGLFEWFRTKEGLIHGYKNAWFSGFPTVELSRIIYKFMDVNENTNRGITNYSEKKL